GTRGTRSPRCAARSRIPTGVSTSSSSGEPSKRIFKTLSLFARGTSSPDVARARGAAPRADGKETGMVSHPVKAPGILSLCGMRQHLRLLSSLCRARGRERPQRVEEELPAAVETRFVVDDEHVACDFKLRNREHP